MQYTNVIRFLKTEEEKLPVRRSHIGNQAYLDEIVTANSIHTEVIFHQNIYIFSCIFKE